MHDSIPVSEVMRTDVVTAAPTETAMDGAKRMTERDVDSVVVVRDGDPVGILTTGDFGTHLCQHPNLGHLELADVMSQPVETIGVEASIVKTATKMRERELEHLPVVADGLVGIVTTTELSYFIPQLRHPPCPTRSEPVPPRRRVRTDTLYERENWEFSYHGSDTPTVSVGDVARFSKRLTADDVKAFAELTGDTNRLHLDADYAAQTRFGERIVHGTLATGLISAALARLPGLTIYLSQEISYLGPIGLEGRATAICTVADDLGGEKYRISTAVEDADGELALEGEAVVLIDELPAKATVDLEEVEEQ